MTEIRPAATVLLLRDTAAGLSHLSAADSQLEVFMVRRHALMGFAGDALVFPGGRIDDTDRVLAGRKDLYAPLIGADESGLAFRIGALRETFEESGILLARHGDQLADGQTVQRLGATRAMIARGDLTFGEVLAREGLTLAIDLLTPFAHWITPPVFPKRYDTMFFLAAAPLDQIAAHDGAESVDSLWITPGAVLAGAVPGRLEFVTRRNLEKVNRASNAAAAIDAARRARIVTVEPVVLDTPQGRTARLPREADYGEQFDFGR